MNHERNFETLARAGYGARGIVYGLLGALTLASALWGIGQGGEQGSTGAMSTLLGQPFGQVMLGLIALGLIGHVLWRLAQALLNADERDHDAVGWATRAGQLASAIANGALALAAARLALGMGGGEGGDNQESLTAWLMSQPFGRWLVGLVGLVIIGVGVVQVYRGVSGKYRDWLDLPSAHAGLLHAICAFGLSARGVLFAVTGGFFIFAALTVDPNQAGSLPEALDWVHGLPFGAQLYGLAALGLIAFGIYSGVEARYRHVDAPDMGKVKRAMPAL